MTGWDGDAFSAFSSLISLWQLQFAGPTEGSWVFPPRYSTYSTATRPAVIFKTASRRLWRNTVFANDFCEMNGIHLRLPEGVLTVSDTQFFLP
jgi:hypothetical protein